MTVWYSGRKTVALLTVNNDAKTSKGTKKGYLTGILYLAPHKLSGANLCPDATPGCIATCLNTAGRGQMSMIQDSRIRKTLRFRNDRLSFMQDLIADVIKLKRKASKLGMIPLVRLNGTSDIPWENVAVVPGACNESLMYMFGNTQFYDYTKSPTRMAKYQMGKLPANYHLTFSRSECNELVCETVLSLGGDVAVVFSTKRGQPLPLTWNGYRVIDGDIDDTRHMDPKGVVVGLRAKGKASHDLSGFVVQV
jgi:hypothetical protein